MHTKDATRIANRVDTDQTAPEEEQSDLGLCSLFAQIFRIIWYFLYLQSGGSSGDKVEKSSEKSSSKHSSSSKKEEEPVKKREAEKRHIDKVKTKLLVMLSGSTP